mmetsp:Transcript_20941/g.45494  ORF Transcript_20941/g.45494 Transcript_20941/m.45494 type:complete len:256 (-) Transcript_20941:1627-2394(-)
MRCDVDLFISLNRAVAKLSDDFLVKLHLKFLFVGFVGNFFLVFVHVVLEFGLLVVCRMFIGEGLPEYEVAPKGAVGGALVPRRWIKTNLIVDGKHGPPNSKTNKREEGVEVVADQERPDVGCYGMSRNQHSLSTHRYSMVAAPEPNRHQSINDIIQHHIVTLKFFDVTCKSLHAPCIEVMLSTATVTGKLEIRPSRQRNVFSWGCHDCFRQSLLGILERKSQAQRNCPTIFEAVLGKFASINWVRQRVDGVGNKS